MLVFKELECCCGQNQPYRTADLLGLLTLILFSLLLSHSLDRFCPLHLAVLASLKSDRYSGTSSRTDQNGSVSGSSSRTDQNPSELI